VDDNRIPVIVLAGYLGSGKTTLLNHLLRHNRGTRIAVLVNDFGSIDVDAMLVAGRVDAVMSLGEGCLCCAVDAGELDQMLVRLTAPDTPVDVVVIEASGLAEPRTLVRMIAAGDNPRARYAGLIEVVDAAEFPRTRGEHPELAEHLRWADLVVLNKADSVAPEQLSHLQAELVELVAPIPVVAARRARVDPALLFDPPQRPRAAEQLSLADVLREDAHHDHEADDHLHHHYDSAAFSDERPMDPRALVEILEDPPRGLFRAKGVVRFAGEGHSHILHLVGRHLEFEPAEPTQRTELVFIGSGLDVAQLTARLHAAQWTHQDPPDPQRMLAVHRYVAHEVDVEPTA
jgi:G3E family GTPase